NADGRSVKGENVLIWDKGILNPNTQKGHAGMEGSHAYKINGMYYITCPAGGTEGWQVCLRSKNIYGPYESKIIMNDCTSYPTNGMHQGGMVQLKNGDWWFIIMQDRGAIGRVPHLMPVKWVDGWPMIGDMGKDLITYPKPKVEKKSAICSPATSDEFASKKLGLQWQWNHNPDDLKWTLSERKGHLRLKASKAESLKNARNTLTQRVQGPSCEGSVAIDLSGLKNGNVAGFGVFEFPYAFVGVRQENGKKELIMCNDGAVIDSMQLKGEQKLWVRARATDKDFTARFYYSLDGEQYHQIGNVLNMGLGLPWTANRFALFNFTTTDEGIDGYADFDWFRFTNK
ncbi:MAG: family 43 glycosylhydrolase, partial [Tannerellaceae bacterium]